MTKRVTIFRNGRRNGGFITGIDEQFTFESLIETAVEKLNLRLKTGRLFTELGAEINENNFNLLRDKDVLYISSGEDFIYPSEHKNGWIALNVGGKHFVTSKANIIENEPNSMLARMFAEENDEFSLQPSCRDITGAYLIDRSPLYFEPILNYLRHRQIIIDKGVNPLGVLEEAKFYGIESMIPQLESFIQNDCSNLKDNTPLTRQEVIRALIKTSIKEDLRFQGVNLCGADLNHLDLRNINFKYANLSRCDLTGANLSYCCLERADLSFANLKGTQLFRIKALCANMEGANLQGCHLDDPSGTNSVLEGVNLKGAFMEGSNMGRVNLRVATLKNANLQNCDLRQTDFAGANLESCDLSGSDLQNANLRGANLKNAIFELMLTPLHMSQTVR